MIKRDSAPPSDIDIDIDMIKLSRKEILYLITLALIVFATRIPFLHLGYGWDYDGWGNVEAGRRIATGEINFVSRPPGYPVVTLVSSKTWHLGPVFINGLTAMFSSICAVMMSLIFLRLNTRLNTALMAGLGLALTPIIFVNSTNAMDYVWALAFSLSSTYSALNKKAALAGVLLGIATGCRLTSLAMILPISIILFIAEDAPRIRYRKLATLLFTTMLMASLTYLPVLQAYGISHFRFSHQPFSVFLPYIPSMILSGLLGPIATVALAASILFAIKSSNAEPAVPATGFSRKILTAACILTICIYCIAYVRLPAESAYLIPAIPFLLLLLGLTISPRVFHVFCICLFISPFLFHLEKDPRNIRIESAPGITRFVNRVSLKGPLLHNKQLRERQHLGIASVFAAAERMGNTNITIIAGSYHEFLRTLTPIQQGKQTIQIAETMNDDDITRLISDGQGVLFIRGYDNVIMLGYTKTPDDDGILTANIEFLFRTDSNGSIKAETPTDLDTALINSGVNAENYFLFLNLLINSPVFVPVHTDGTPVNIRYMGLPMSPVFDHPDRYDSFRGLGHTGTASTNLARRTFQTLPPGFSIALNMGGPTERIFSEKEIQVINNSLQNRPVLPSGL